jgi:sulfur-carrier protein
MLGKTEKEHSMRVSIRFAGDIACLTNNNKLEYELKNRSTLDDFIALMDRQFSGVRSSICTEHGDVADHINVYVNGDNVRYLDGLGTELKDGDAIHVIPAAAAG